MEQALIWFDIVIYFEQKTDIEYLSQVAGFKFN